MTLPGPTRELCLHLARSPVVVLEGCDGAGKTTLADHLAGTYGYDVQHSSRSAGDVDLLDRYRAILAGPGPLALDRSFVSELVYGPVRHGGSRLSWDQAVELTGLVTARGGVLVHLAADPRCILERLHSRHDGEVWELDDVCRIQDRYEHVFDGLRSHAVVLRHRTDRQSTT